MAEVKLLGKWPEDETQIKNVYTGAEIKELAYEIDKEVKALERQADYHRNMDRDAEVKHRVERAQSLKLYIPKINKAVSSWYKD